MSVPVNRSNLNATIAIDQGIYEVSTSQKASLGTRLSLGDRTWYYAQASASVAGGTVLCANPALASYQSGLFSIVATSAGVKIITATIGTLAVANAFAEGYFGEALGTGAGELYRIKANDAGSTGFAVTLYDGLNTPTTSAANYYMVANLFKNVFVGSEAVDTPIGVAPTAVTSGGYFWAQTWGMCNPKHVAATPASAAVRLGTTGSVIASITTGTQGSTGFAPVDYGVTIGKNIGLAATAGQANPVFLMIMP